MAVENSSIFLGSGASMTLVPEVDFYFRLVAGTTDTVQIEATNAVQFQLVKDMYVGCTLDWYDGGTVYTSSHTITANDHDTFNITPDLGATSATADACVLRAYGAPCPAPDSDNDGTGKTRLHADNWLGLIETASFPNIEVEMKQLNLALGGSRNFTHQYKGIETASGGNLALVCNHATWLYYALGKCTTLTVANAVTSEHPSNYHVGTHGGMYFNNGGHTDEGPFIYRANSVSGTTHLVPPLLFTVDDTVAELDAIPTNSGHIVATGGLITYKFEETNGAHLPSFALEYSLTKDVTNNFLSDQDADGVGVGYDYESINFVRVARGNRVNTLTLTANENEELKMTMDLNTRAVTPIPQILASPSTGYESRGGQAVNNDLFNFTSESAHLAPFFFSDGSISIFGQQFLKVTNFTLTINNTLMDKRFIGAGNKSVKDGIPSQRTYEISLTALVTDDRLFRELLNQDENNDATQSIDLVFTKDGGESLTLAFDDYFMSANNWTVPEDKGPITVEATLMPRTLTNCTTTTHWVLQG
tara:strand:- start:164 stop:1759 length:1596 start_codon:yes stop_codon:yes gene_type:complete